MSSALPPIDCMHNTTFCTLNVFLIMSLFLAGLSRSSFHYLLTFPICNTMCVCEVIEEFFLEFPFAPKLSFLAKSNPFLPVKAWSCLLATTRLHNLQRVPPEAAEPLLGKCEGLQVLFSSTLLSSLAGLRDFRSFLCFCLFSDPLRGARSKHGMVRSGGRNGW